jgi:hypothetical protein
VGLARIVLSTNSSCATSIFRWSKCCSAYTRFLAPKAASVSEAAAVYDRPPAASVSGLSGRMRTPPSASRSSCAA